MRLVRSRRPGETSRLMAGDLRDPTNRQLDAAPPFAQFGVGRRSYVPALMVAGLLEVFYFLIVWAVIFKAEAWLRTQLPLVAAASAAVTFLVAQWVKGKWESYTVHRAGIWLDRSKVVLGDFVADEKRQRDFTADEIHGLAARFEAEGYIPLRRAQGMRSRATRSREAA